MAVGAVLLAVALLACWLPARRASRVDPMVALRAEQRVLLAPGVFREAQALGGHRATTFRKQAKQAGLEPDECYVLGRELDEVPDLAIEVVVSSGGLAKHDIHARLGVREVWFWTADGFALYALAGPSCERTSNSRLIAQLDFELLAKHVRRTDQPQAVREYRDAVRAAQK